MRFCVESSGFRNLTDLDRFECGRVDEMLNRLERLNNDHHLIGNRLKVKVLSHQGIQVFFSTKKIG